MKPVADPSLLRHRRAVEAGQLVARGSSIVLLAMLVAGWFHVFPNGMAGPLVAACLGMILLMALAEVLGVLNVRRPNGPRYLLRSAAQVGSDLVVVLGFVAIMRIYTEITTWPALIVPIVVGALRFRLAGALGIWALTSAFAPFALSLGHHAAPPGELIFVVAISLIIACISGTQASALSRQVRELDVTRRALEHQAGHDYLTGLPNRSHLTQFAETQDGVELAVLLLDLNGFKQINDVFGHAAGDELLRQTGRRIQAALRDGDLAGRLGGDEFQVLLPHCGPEEAAEVIRRLRVEIAQPIGMDGRLVEVGVSIGVAHRRAGEQASLEALTASADRAMYEEKAAKAQPVRVD